MEKIDVEMEDVTKHPQDLGDDGKIKLSEVDTKEEQNKVEELKDTKVEADEPNNVVNEVMDPNKTVISEGVKESEDSINVTSEVQENAEVQDNNDVAKEDIMETENANNVQDEGVKEIDNANHVTNGQPNVKSETNNVVDKKDNEDAVIEKTASEQGQPPVDEVANDVADEVANEVSKSVDVSIPDAVEETNKEETVIEVKEVENKVTCNGDGEKIEIAETKTENKVVMERVNVAKEEADNKDIPEGITASTPVKAKHEIDDHEPATPNVLAKCSIAKAGNHSGETHKNVFYELKIPGNDDGTPEEQMAFMRELETFSRERATEFKPPKFYGHQLNCLKLWRHVIRLGGYDRVTGSKLWRQVGESFHPPKTCTTVSWTFRIFYEKALLEYERYKRDSGELQLPISPPDSAVGAADPEGNGFQASGSGRVRRDSAARAMQGWHNDPSEKSVSTPKREKNLKSIGSLKQKRPNEVDTPVKTPRNETSRELVASVVDVGSPPADWVKISVRETRDSFEVYALVPGLLREEVRVQSDPAGRLVITGTPEQAENPWGISAFKKVVSLPGRIDPLQTSAVVSLHGRLYVKVPFEQGN